MKRGERSQPMDVVVIGKLARTLFVGLLIPWVLSSFIRIRPVVMVSFPFVLIIPKFLFRRRKIVIEWTAEDWVWLFLSFTVLYTYSQGLNLLSLVKAIHTQVS